MVEQLEGVGDGNAELLKFNKLKFCIESLKGIPMEARHSSRWCQIKFEFQYQHFLGVFQYDVFLLPCGHVYIRFHPKQIKTKTVVLSYTEWAYILAYSKER